MDINSYISSCTQILPGLWLGNEAASQNANFVNKNHITLIVNCSKKISNAFEVSHISNTPGIRYIRLPVNDPGPLIVPSRNQDNLDMIILVPQAAEIIRESLNRGESVLVHCHAGAQRSATVVIYYLMRYGRFRITPEFTNAMPQKQIQILYNSAVNYVVSKRPFVYYGGLHNNFKYALEQICGCDL